MLFWMKGREKAAATLFDPVLSNCAICPLRKSDEKLRHAVDDLLNSNGELEQFASIAAHDLKSPLMKIRLLSEHLEQKDLNLDAEDEDYIKCINEAAVKMNDLINDLLEYSRISHTLALFDPIDLRVLISEIEDDFQEVIRIKNAGIEVGELPRVNANPSQMRQVFKNLIENALKYCRKDGQPPLIRIDAKISGNFAEIYVRDNGIGFDQMNADQIFEPFRRLHEDSEYEGTGMGLAICRKIIQAHGGDISAASALGEGSVFLIKLPLSHFSG